MPAFAFTAGWQAGRKFSCNNNAKAMRGKATRAKNGQ